MILRSTKSGDRKKESIVYLICFFNSYLKLDMNVSSICKKRLKEKILNNRPPFHPYPS